MHGVIFDMDGVLVDSNEAHFEAFKRMGEKIGTPFTIEILQKTFGMHNTQIFPLWLGQHITRAEAMAYGEEKERIYRDIAATKLKEVPGAIDLVRRVRKAGFKMAVGSSGPRENVALALSTLQIDDAFDFIVTGSDISTGKPNPEVFLKAATGLNLKPKHCLVIEDAPGGVQAGLNAGMKVIAITTSRPANDLAGAALVVDHLRAISTEQITSLLES